MSLTFDETNAAPQFRNVVFAPAEDFHVVEEEAPPAPKPPIDWGWRGVGLFMALCVFSAAVLTIH
ncbi:hypothetical protein [Terrarubrum flagellatum]|uniref:hypothetical protein n=1 Tax=Terrirubrum flagellatum TaxID=2895980 RepID=UPI003145616A